MRDDQQYNNIYANTGKMAEFSVLAVKMLLLS